MIRVNPDVLIRNDTFILASMADESISGIFVDYLDKPCPSGRGCSDRIIHTDFFAVRPSAVSLGELRHINETGAETMATKAFSGIVQNGRTPGYPAPDRTYLGGSASRGRGELGQGTISSLDEEHIVRAVVVHKGDIGA